MSDKKHWYILAGLTATAAIGLGTAIYFENETLLLEREAVLALETEIKTSRALVETTSAIEKDVIVLRELSAVFEQVLPTSEDANNLIQDFYRYSGEASVDPSSFKAKAPAARARGTESAFDKVAYTLTLTGDAFQFLDFLNRIETHSRFMAVPSFNLTACSRTDLENYGFAKHKIQVDVETYVYTPTSIAEQVRIEGYERKRDLLANVISRRRQALTLSSFNYRGERGRRDPWIDPRVPLEENPSGLTVSEQNEQVDGLTRMYQDAVALWSNVEAAENVLERMMAKKDLIEVVARIEDDLRRVDAGGLISYTPAVKRLQNEVRTPLLELRLSIEETRSIQGPVKEELEHIIGTMRRDIEAGNFTLAQQSYAAIKDSLDLLQGDPVRMELALALRRLAEEAEILREFDSFEMSFGGQVLIEGRSPAVLINNRTLTIGDMLRPGLEVIGIRPHEVDFAFRGVVLVRAF